MLKSLVVHFVLCVVSIGIGVFLHRYIVGDLAKLKASVMGEVEKVREEIKAKL